MIKKLLYLALPIAALTIVGIQTASADYYDCEGNVRPGTPGPSECHYLTQPPSAIPTEPVQPLVTPCQNGNCGIYQFQPTFPPYTVVIPDDQDDEDDVEEIPNDVTVDIRNTRKYCVRNYCYFIFEICYSNGYCEKKAERVDRDDYGNDYDYNRNRNWRDGLNNYVYNYFYNNYYYGYSNCDHDRNDCVYRGTHYGRYTNRYWDF